jgi:hypothetical protein
LLISVTEISGAPPRMQADISHENYFENRAQQLLPGQLRLFGGIRCYRHSLHTYGIETQKLGKTICDVPTAESI